MCEVCDFCLIIQDDKGSALEVGWKFWAFLIGVDAAELMAFMKDCWQLERNLQTMLWWSLLSWKERFCSMNWVYYCMRLEIGLILMDFLVFIIFLIG